MNFYQYNLLIRPQNLSKNVNMLSYAISYLMKILNILLNYNKNKYNVMAKLVHKVATQYGQSGDDL